MNSKRKSATRPVMRSLTVLITLDDEEKLKKLARAMSKSTDQIFRDFIRMTHARYLEQLAAASEAQAEIVEPIAEPEGV